jgi:hypothetical protein
VNRALSVKHRVSKFILEGEKSPPLDQREPRSQVWEKVEWNAQMYNLDNEALYSWLWKPTAHTWLLVPSASELLMQTGTSVNDEPFDRRNVGIALGLLNRL